MANRIRCISIDIDGTLCKDEDFMGKRISPDNVSEMKKFYESGGRMILATGRDYRNAELILKRLYGAGIPMDAIPYVVCMNGALIIDNRDHRTVVYKRNFNEVLCREMVKFLMGLNLNIFLLASDNRFYMKSNFWSRVIYKFLYKTGKFVYNPFPLYENTDLSLIQRVIIIKLTSGLEEVKRKVVEKFGEKIYCSSGPGWYLEIIDRWVNKFYALEKISRIINVPISEFAAIGNEENDILSLQSVGFGAAVDMERKKGKFHWDEEKIGGHYTNEGGNAVAKAIRDMRSKGFF